MKTKAERKDKKTGRKSAVSYTAGKAVDPAVLEEAAHAYDVSESPMIRTQIYLSRPEHEFVQLESARRGQPMAAVIRAFIDEKMNIPDSAWTNNSLLAPPADSRFAGPEDGAVNHDHYVYGTPKKWLKRKGQWAEAPPLPEDYHTNESSAARHDREVEEKG